MKRIYIITVTCSVLMILFFFIGNSILNVDNSNEKSIKVGFVLIGDESIPYSYNFIRSQKAVESKFGKNVEILVKENVAEGTEEIPTRDLISKGCNIIFTTSYGYGEITKKLAIEYPDIQFCQATCSNANESPVVSNYHTFMGHIYEGRYVTGVVAGMKMDEMIKEGTITADEARIGYVAAFPIAETISGYTAFLLGVRSVVPSAVMTVKYTYQWSNYRLEKNIAKDMINDGCVIISQHSDTIGPAVACEELKSEKEVYHVGYNQNMIDDAPTTSLIGTRINYTPYILSAVEAVLDDAKIEDCVKGVVNGNDIGAGFEEDWVQMLELNSTIAASGTKEKIEETINSLNNHNITVFKGDYIGVDPFDSTDIYDLNQGYMENKNISAPTFHYVLNDIIKVIK